MGEATQIYSGETAMKRVENATQKVEEAVNRFSLRSTILAIAMLVLAAVQVGVMLDSMFGDSGEKEPAQTEIKEAQ